MCDVPNVMEHRNDTSRTDKKHKASGLPHRIPSALKGHLSCLEPVEVDVRDEHLRQGLRQSSQTRLLAGKPIKEKRDKNGIQTVTVQQTDKQTNKMPKSFRQYIRNR